MSVVPSKMHGVTEDGTEVTGLKLMFTDSEGKDHMIVTREGPSGCQVLPVNVSKEVCAEEAMVCLKDLGRWKPLSDLERGEEKQKRVAHVWTDVKKILCSWIKRCECL